MPTDDQHPQPGDDLPRPVPPALPDDVLKAYPDLRRVGTKLPLRDYLRELWRRREFAVTVPLGELRAQNQDTALGQLWHLLNPLFLIAIYYFVFGIVLEVEGRRGVDDYLPFLIVGIIVFNYTRSSMQSGARMIVKNRKLVQSINFPRAILPISSLVSETVSHLYAIPVMVVLLFTTNLLDEPTVTLTWHWILLVPITVMQAVFNLGLAMAVGRFAFHFRDVQQFMPYALRLWFYMSGVLYPVQEVIEQRWIQAILAANPAWSIIEIARDSLLYQQVVGWKWAVAAIWSVLLLLFGFWYFRQAENEYGRV